MKALVMEKPLGIMVMRISGSSFTMAIAAV